MLAESQLTRRLSGSMVEALPLPAGQARREGETNLDDRGELTGEVSEPVLRNGENLGFLVAEAAPPRTPRVLGWKRTQKRTRAEANGSTLVRSLKAKRKFRANSVFGGREKRWNVIHD